MSLYPIHITSKIDEEKLLKGTFLFIFRATRIPPHIGIITNGKLFDITTVGPNIGLSVTDFYKTVLKRKTEVIFIELHHYGEDRDELENIITNKVTHYWKVTEGVSCLNPIKDFINEAFDKEVKHANFIFELLPILYENDIVKDVSQLNLSNKIKNNVFSLNKYTADEISYCIKALTRKETIC
jgi:fumarylacetoacetate (FAA) hydrolase family protein